jgi:hypothetical protein
MLMLSILVSKKVVAKQEHVHVCIKSLNRLVCTACWPDLDANFECILNLRLMMGACTCNCKHSDGLTEKCYLLRVPGEFPQLQLVSILFTATEEEEEDYTTSVNCGFGWSCRSWLTRR